MIYRVIKEAEATGVGGFGLEIDGVSKQAAMLTSFER